MVDVRLVDLEVIKRYSLAVRRDSAPAAELLEALDASRAVVTAALAAQLSGAQGGAPRAPVAADTTEEPAPGNPGEAG